MILYIKFSYESYSISGSVHNVLIIESFASFDFCSCILTLQLPCQAPEKNTIFKKN